MNSIQNLRDCSDAVLVGGKAANLGALLRAGFAVPDGFVITTAAGEGDTEAIRKAYRALNASNVVVRSSATNEDSSERSMAGLFKTVLNVHTEVELFQAIQLCRASLQKARTHLFSSENHVTGDTAMAVVVQRQIAPDVAGVLFTNAPLSPDEMLIEAGRGSAEDIIAGRRQPDKYRVGCRTGRIIRSETTDRKPSLAEADVTKLWKLGHEVESILGSPQDIEWAIADDQLFLLQARPITTSDRVTLRFALIETAKKRLAQAKRGPWLIHNLAETLPHPTPLTWSVLRRFMSSSGGFGAMYRRLGFEPADTEFVELILGKIYMDMSRAPELFGKNFPFAYDAQVLRSDSNVAQQPPSVPRGSWFARLSATWQMSGARRRIDVEGADFDHRLKSQIIPAFLDWCAEEKKRDLSELSAEEWIELWQDRERRVLSEFASEIFFTNFITAFALQRLRDFLAETFWDDSPDALVQLLLCTGAPNRTLLADAELREVGQGKQSTQRWLATYGHRAINEFDLATPRWREIPSALSAYAARFRDAPDPLDLYYKRTEQARKRIVRLPLNVARRVHKEVEFAQRYLIFREDGKHYLMFGYDLLRDMVLDASRRLGADVVWLTFDELGRALRGAAVPKLQLAQRKREYHAEARIRLTQFIDSDTLAKLGDPPTFDDYERFEGTAISTGFASGPVRIVRSPLEAGDLGSGFVLVCPSIDPEWTPLFLNASALVLECGGTLSHAAIVAREMNLPAIVLPDATQLLHEGELIFVNGSSGIVSRKPESANAHPNDVLAYREKLPPVPGTRERRAARIRNVGFLFWSAFLLATWILPKSWLYHPSLRVLDSLLWPAVRTFGRPAAVAIIGAGVAFAAALTQALIADNVRVCEARRRIRALTTKAAALPMNSVRRKRFMSIVGPVYLRIVGAGLVPGGILLGVFILSFTWLVVRMDQSNPLPGTPARVLARIDPDFREPVILSVSPPLRLDESSSQSRSLPPIRETLERLASTQLMSNAELADLRQYLHRGLPPQILSWTVHSDKPGSFPITLILGKAPKITESVVFGDHSPPPDDCTIRNHPLRSVTVESVVPKPPFWNFPATHLLNRYFNWPWIYLGAYFPTWLLLRRLLKLA